MAKFYDFSYAEVLDGQTNMSLDWQNLLQTEKSGVPLYRLYGWREPTLSLGYRQKVHPFELPLVRRPTGGGALLHGWDLSFSYTGLKELWGRRSTQIYNNFMGVLLEKLRELEKNFDMSTYRGSYEDYFCYFYPTLGEITLSGKKIVACAMRVLKDSFLIHGSFFLSMDYEFFQNLTGISSTILKERIITFEDMGIDVKEVERLLKDSLKV